MDEDAPNKWTISLFFLLIWSIVSFSDGNLYTHPQLAQNISAQGKTLTLWGFNMLENHANGGFCCAYDVKRHQGHHFWCKLCHFSPFKISITPTYSYLQTYFMTIADAHTVFLLRLDTSAQFYNEVQWTAALRLFEYKGFHSASLLRYKIPTATARLQFEFRGAQISESCSKQHVNVYAQHGSYPVIRPYNESFPEHFYLNRTNLHHVSVQTNNYSVPLSINNPLPGLWFLAAFIPKGQEKIAQKGLNKHNCLYGLNIEVVSSVQEDVEEIDMDKTTKIKLTELQSTKMIRYIPPEGIHKYTVVIDGCSVKGQNTTTTSCPVDIDVSMETLPTKGSNKTVSHDCSNSSIPCQIDIQNPVIMTWNYFKITSNVDFEHVESVTVHLRFIAKSCFLNLYTLKNRSSPTPEEINSTSVNTSDSNVVYYPDVSGSKRQKEECILLMGLGRLNFAKTDFSSLFVFADATINPVPDSLILVPDTLVLVAYFKLNADTDSGGTFKVDIETAEDILENTQDGTIWFCMMKNVIPDLTSVKTCPGGIGLTINTTSKAALSSKIYIPYPEEGRWYFGINSQCYKKNHSRSVEKCKHYPVLRLHLSVARCVDEQCGRFGVCQEFISGLLVISSCKCYAGWRGYGCSDGTEAESDATMLTSTLLLTLSNLLFIPGIIIACYRRYFVEALVYTYTMFFSTFYHACDTNAVVHHYCMMKYDVLSYCDFLGSIMSFWVTILAMARIKDGIRSFLHMLGAMCLALGVEYDRHGLWVFVVPAVTGVIIMFISWIVQCHMRKSCYPTKWRYLKFLMPGVLLAGTGLVIFAFLETEDNYKYTHSAWHAVMALCIIFLLPTRSKADKGRKWYIGEGQGEEVISMIKDAANSEDSDVEEQDGTGVINNSYNREESLNESINNSARDIIL